MAGVGKRVNDHGGPPTDEEAERRWVARRLSPQSPYERNPGVYKHQHWTYDRTWRNVTNRESSELRAEASTSSKTSTVSITLKRAI